MVSTRMPWHTNSALGTHPSALRFSPFNPRKGVVELVHGTPERLVIQLLALCRHARPGGEVVHALVQRIAAQAALGGYGAGEGLVIEDDGVAVGHGLFVQLAEGVD